MSGLDSYLAVHRPISSGASFADGQMLGEWRITAFLGKGGSAEVYQVENVRTGALAAAKILMRDDEVARERFRREVAILAKNDCPSFPQYFADGEADGRLYLIVELLDQCPLPSADREVERYAAPEQFAGGDISPASDIHALGVLLEKFIERRILSASSWKKIIRRATSSIPSERYQSVEEFVAAIRHRKRGRHIAICLLALAVLAGGVMLAGRLGQRLPEEIAWGRLCGEQVATNVVRQELVEVKWLDKGGMRVPAERRYRIVTNRVEVVPIQLGGVTNVFENPIRLKSGREYWVTGPGVLDGAFYAEGTNVTIRLKNCIMRNHAAEPMGKVGINYDLQDGAGLDLPELDESDDHGRHYIERNGSPTRLTFKGTWR